MIDFSEFYFHVHNHHPFPWQIRLAKEVVANGWTEQQPIRLPTASGKTSLVDIAVYALAAQAVKPTRERNVPLRTFFVVDRRLVVDDVTRHASKLAAALNHPTAGALAEVRELLLSFNSGCPLLVTTLRGGMYRSDAWADAPNQPLICVSTVDQVGSRLLFRGYGVSTRKRPVDAGLVGCDSLIILDEAHLSEPFIQTVQAVKRYIAWSEQAFRPVQLIKMSATANREGSFGLDSDDFQNSTLTQRLNATKTATLREVANLEQEAVTEAKRLASKPEQKIVAVVVNTVSAARVIFEQLRNPATPDAAVLLTGRIRPYDRDALLARFLDRMKAGRARDQDQPLFLVATQTVEVGADLDFDSLVTESAPLDSLRQRFGRLNRLGKLGYCEAVILHRKPVRGEPDRVYGPPVQKTWTWLTQHAEDNAGAQTINFGARHMQELFDAHGSPELNADTDIAPLLTPAHVETWIQTHPTPDPDPGVEPFLHGLNSMSADVNFIWRADIEKENELQHWAEMLDVSPPVPMEALPVPIWVAQKWLKRQKSTNLSDLEGSEDNTADTKPEEDSPRQFLLWRGPEDSRSGTPDAMRPGDTIVLRSNEGGSDEFGWNPESEQSVRDIGNECTCQRARQAGGRYIVRLAVPNAIAQTEEDRERLKQYLSLWEKGETEEAVDGLVDLLSGCYPERSRRDWKAHADRLNIPYFTTKWIKPPENTPCNLPEEADEDDLLSFTVPVSLATHVEGVVQHVRRFGIAAGIDPHIAEALEAAAHMHDLGKCDERFQILLGGAGGQSGQLLAKSEGGLSQSEQQRRRSIANYPQNARHELWSVALAEHSAKLSGNPLRDLILHLIGTHHGYGRPFAPTWQEQDQFEVVSRNAEHLRANGTHLRALWSLGSGWAERFKRLNRTYGYWGLAYLEAILRRADCLESRKEQQSHS